MTAGKRLNYDRRNFDSFGIYNRTQIAEIIDKLHQGLGSGNPNGYVRNPEYAIRDAALEAFEYLLAKRVSEFTGRKFDQDVYAGLTTDHWRMGKEGQTDVLQVYLRILKRSKRKRECPSCKQLCNFNTKFCPGCGTDVSKQPITTRSMKQIWRWKSIKLSDPFTHYIIDWLLYLKEHKIEGRVFAISRVAAWNIMKNVGIMNHVNRGWRATHLSDTMKPHELKDELDRTTLPTEYMHVSPKRRQAAIDKADEEWQ